MNELQKKFRVEKFVQWGLLFTILVGIVLLITGVRSLTKNLPAPKEKPFAPRLTQSPSLSIQGHDQQPQKPAAPTIEYFTIDGQTVQGVVTD